MEIEQISLLVLILGMSTLSFGAYISDLGRVNANVSYVLSSDFNATFNNINFETQRINQSEGQLFSKGINSDFGFLPTIQSFFGVGTILKDSIKTITQMFESISTELALPVWIVTSLTAIFTTLLMFAIYRATLGRQKL